MEYDTNGCKGLYHRTLETMGNTTITASLWSIYTISNNASIHAFNYSRISKRVKLMPHRITVGHIGGGVNYKTLSKYRL